MIRSQGENTLSLLNGASAQSVWQLSSTGWTPPSPAAIAAWLSERKDAAKSAGRPPFLPLNEYNARDIWRIARSHMSKNRIRRHWSSPPGSRWRRCGRPGLGLPKFGRAVGHFRQGNCRQQRKELWWFSAGEGETVGVPAVADVDGDGTADFIATFADKHPALTAIRNVWIEAVSGKTGKSLWRFRLEGAVRSLRK